jgi:Uma2 family endonuclease
MERMSTIVVEPEIPSVPASPRGGPTFEVASLFPLQGFWTEGDYLSLKTNKLVELVDGFIEVLPVPTIFHQLIAAYLMKCVEAFLEKSGTAGLVVLAPMPVRLFPGTMREPDVVYLRPERIVDTRRQPNGADLVMEIMSPGSENRERDLVDKRRDYSQAGIQEYWIVDPESTNITVLELAEGAYREHGVFGRGTRASSKILHGLEVSVDALFAAGEGKRS